MRVRVLMRRLAKAQACVCLCLLVGTKLAGYLVWPWGVVMAPLWLAPLAYVGGVIALALLFVPTVRLGLFGVAVVYAGMWLWSVGS